MERIDLALALGMLLVPSAAVVLTFEPPPSQPQPVQQPAQQPAPRQSAPVAPPLQANVPLKYDGSLSLP